MCLHVRNERGVGNDMIHLWHKWGKVKQWGGIPQRKCLICGKLEQDVTAVDGCGGMIKFLEEEERRKQWEKVRVSLKDQKAVNDQADTFSTC